ncbi:MAG: hypothetical protein U0175_19895 [Caldilineaceae bacterium]
MRLLRFVGLLAIIAVIYFAQYIFDHGTLTEFFPDWFLVRFTFASRVMRWQPDDLNILAWGGAAVASIFFGLIAPAWPSTQGLSYVAPVVRRGRTPTALFAIVAMCLALLLTTFVFAGVSLPIEPFGTQAVWLLSSLFALFTGLLLNRPRSLQVRNITSSNPERSWLLVIFVLIGAGFLFSFNLLELPPSIAREIANYGLQAQATFHDKAIPDLLVTGIAGRPLLTTLLTAIVIRITGDVLWGMRVAGVVAGVLTVFATWLAGCELFRRAARRGRQDEVVEDDGRFPALIAAAIVAGSVVAIHFSRLPVLLEPIFWGTLGVWALLRGMRRADSFGLALSGLLAGYATLLVPSGMALLLVMFILLLASTLFPGLGFPKAIAEARRWGWAIWLLAVLCMLSPVLRMWLTHPQSFWLDFPGLGSTFFRNTLANLIGLQISYDKSSLLGYPGHFLHSVLAPLWLLAIGGLLLNIDRVPGWALTLWLIVAAAVAAALSPQVSSWPELLPILPAFGLAVAFTIDRIRATLFDTLGAWINQSAIYLGIGLVLWAALANWIAYVHYIDTSRDTASEMAIAVRKLDNDRKFVIVDSEDGHTPGWDNPVLQLVESEAGASEATLQERFQLVPMTQLANTLSAGSVLLIVPEGNNALARAQELYPSAALTVERDRRGNPVLYVLEVQ